MGIFTRKKKMEGINSVGFVLFVVVGLSFAQQKCCYPNQFEALDGQVVGTVTSGKGVVLLESIQFAFDYTNKRVGQLAGIQFEGQIYNYLIIIDYNKRVEYIIQEKLKTCQKIALPAVNMTNCIPSDALYTNSFYVGDHKMTVDAFSVSVKQEPLEGNTLFSVSRGDCIPNSVTFFGTQGQTPLLTVAGFVNYTEGIQDPSKYFTVPTYCNQPFSQEPKMYNSILHKIFG